MGGASAQMKHKRQEKEKRTMTVHGALHFCTTRRRRAADA